MLSDATPPSGGRPSLVSTEENLRRRKERDAARARKKYWELKQRAAAGEEPAIETLARRKKQHAEAQKRWRKNHPEAHRAWLEHAAGGAGRKRHLVRGEPSEESDG